MGCDACRMNIHLTSPPDLATGFWSSHPAQDAVSLTRKEDGIGPASAWAAGEAFRGEGILPSHAPQGAVLHMPVRRSARLSARGRAECPPPEGPDSEPNHGSINMLRDLLHGREGILPSLRAEQARLPGNPTRQARLRAPGKAECLPSKDTKSLAAARAFELPFKCRCAWTYSMKVVQVLPALQGGGVERGTLEIASALVAAGHESVVLSAGGRMVAELEAGGSRHVRWALGRKHPAVALEVRRLRRWLARERPDILHVRSRVPAWVCWLAWRGMAQGRRPRFVTTLHGLHSVSPFSAIMARGERVIVVSETARRYLLNNYVDPPVPALRRTGLTRDRMHRIYRGIDPSRYPRAHTPCSAWLAQWQRDFPMLNERRMVILPGRLTRLKGHEDFPAIMELVSKQHPDAVGVVVGGEEGAKARLRRVDSRRLARHRLHRTTVPTCGRSWPRSSAVVSLSNRPESFGRVVLEALSLGVPVVGYDHGGVGEILEQVFPEGRTPMGDADQAATRLLAVLDDETGARSRIRDHDFTLQRMCQEDAGAVRGTGGGRMDALIVLAGFGLVALAAASFRFAWWRPKVPEQHPRVLTYHMVREPIPAPGSTSCACRRPCSRSRSHG